MIKPNSPEESHAGSPAPTDDGGAIGGGAGASIETHESFLQIPPLKTTKFKPNSNYIRLDYEKPDKVGEIIMPGQAKGLEWITATALDVGPECKVVQKGDKVLLASKGMVNGANGILVEGRVTFWSQENMIIGVLE